MILYGRDLSPFVRRVAIWCQLQERSVERRPITVQGADFDELKRMNPLGRVPVLVLDDGATLVDTKAICDWLDETTPNGVRLLPEAGVARREALQWLALGNGTAEKAVALVYDRNRRPEQYHWMDWQQRLVGQIRGGLAALDAAVPARAWSGAAPSAGDIAAVIAYEFVAGTNPWVLEPGYPRLAEFADWAGHLAPIAETRP